MPAGGKTGYMFIQRYAGSNLKPLFDDLINITLEKYGYKIAGARASLKPITTKHRLEKFLEISSLRDITIISKSSNHDTGSGDAKSVTIKLRNITVNSSDRKISKKVVSDAMKNHGFTLGEKQYEMTATYETKVDGKKEEEKTTKLDETEDTINIIPNILLPLNCIDGDGYPIFIKMKEYVTDEITQIREEIRM
ncbi:MAG: hypothetical protein HRT66_04330 [Flavobacteriaceae bacterium]|nr:hypothetical protein [Flavobacteriaceae bacterium]